jgi:hypothetical protein
MNAFCPPFVSLIYTPKPCAPLVAIIIHISEAQYAKFPNSGIKSPKSENGGLTPVEGSPKPGCCHPVDNATIDVIVQKTTNISIMTVPILANGAKIFVPFVEIIVAKAIIVIETTGINQFHAAKSVVSFPVKAKDI